MLVANRGEIVVRIVRTLASLGIRSVAVFSPADAGAVHALTADVAVGIDSYLGASTVVTAAIHAGADAVHPGYGFLSEDPAFARAVLDAGLTWIGPPPEAIELMGDKIRAKETVAAAGVPVVPGTEGSGLTDAELLVAADEIGFPVLIKPAAGGGGKGMRRVEHPAEMADELAAARREAAGAFGDDTLLLERWVRRPRHIEVQVFADAHGGVLHLGERECSLQRRHQKIVEECPSPLLDEATRARIGASAVAAARSCGYVGAGTVEFIVSADRPDEVFFMEMNTRLQVEHPVTEAVTGIDLVEWQVRVAAGERLPVAQDRIAFTGHAVEARIYAEDPARGFLPSAGTILALTEPIGRPGIRVDSALVEGATVGTGYDPMLAKVIGWGADRAEALGRLRQALAGTTVLGVATNVGFLVDLLGHPDVAAGRLDTELVERVAAELQAGGTTELQAAIVAGSLLAADLGTPGSPTDPWDLPDGWRLGGNEPTIVALDRPTGPLAVAVSWETAGPPGSAVADVSVDGGPAVAVAVERFGHGPNVLVTTAANRTKWSWATERDAVWVGQEGRAWRFGRAAATAGRATQGSSGGSLTSPMPGTVVAVHASAGDHVDVGQPLVVVEAMKMEHTVRAPDAGTVAEMLVKVGQAVGLDQPLAVLGLEGTGEPGTTGEPG
ncbi:MAG TPA: biotin carboxylase N-terminal domain-containing protein, partial [Acidimicrobiales bacterium]|nr:biotin carboxylase N-terminal domain-containing protein [Acidimicrobiales bacterium]